MTLAEHIDKEMVFLGIISRRRCEVLAEQYTAELADVYCLVEAAEVKYHIPGGSRLRLSDAMKKSYPRRRRKAQASPPSSDAG